MKNTSKAVKGTIWFTCFGMKKHDKIKLRPFFNENSV